MREVIASERPTTLEHGAATVEPPDPDRVERGEFVVRSAETGAPLFVQARLDADLRPLRIGLPKVKYEGLTSEGRMSGLRYAHRTFGYRTRQPLRRRESCSACNTAVDYPEVHRCIESITTDIEGLFADFHPAEYERQRALVADVILPEWRMGGGLWTSGIINQTSALTYHRDRNNLATTWSAMLVMRRHLRGGYLHVPALDLYASCDDGHVLIFEGASLLHGVTGFHIRPGGYRYTLVYYALTGMKACLPLRDEVAWGARNRTERETAQADALEAPDA